MPSAGDVTYRWTDTILPLSSVFWHKSQQNTLFLLFCDQNLYWAIGLLRSILQYCEQNTSFGHLYTTNKSWHQYTVTQWTRGGEPLSQNILANCYRDICGMDIVRIAVWLRCLTFQISGSWVARGHLAQGQWAGLQDPSGTLLFLQFLKAWVSFRQLCFEEDYSRLCLNTHYTDFSGGAENTAVYKRKLKFKCFVEVIKYVYA